MNINVKSIIMQAGYSGTPLAKKLGIREGMKIRLANEPAYYFDLFSDMPLNIQISRDKRQGKDFIHYFTKEKDDLLKNILVLKNEINPNGMIWISWPKKSSKVITDVTENDIRDIALANGLVDIKVCAIDDTWSGLKLVIPVKNRKLE